MPILVLPAEAYDRSGISTLYCAAFEVDQNDKVVGYDSDWVRFYAQTPWPRLQQCMGKMIPKEELIAERDRLRHEVMTKGDAKAYRKLKETFKDPDVQSYWEEFHRQRQSEEVDMQ